jgi:hypothetical protein
MRQIKEFNDWCNKLVKPLIPALNYFALTISLTMMGLLIYVSIVGKFDEMTWGLILYVIGMTLGMDIGISYILKHIKHK